MTNKSLARVGGVCGILGVVFFIAGFALLIASGESSADLRAGAFDKYFSTLAENGTLYVAGLWFSTLATGILPVPFFVGLYMILRRPRSWLLTGLLVMLGGALIGATGLVIGMGPMALVSAYSAASGGDTAIIGAMALVMADVGRNMMTLHNLFYAVAVLIFGVAMLRPQVLPRWPAFFALAAGILLIPWMLQFVAPVFMWLGLLGVLLLVVWFVATGVAMIRAEVPDEP